jgi:hypothetical protein
MLMMSAIEVTCRTIALPAAQYLDDTSTKSYACRCSLNYVTTKLPTLLTL